MRLTVMECHAGVNLLKFDGIVASEVEAESLIKEKGFDPLACDIRLLEPTVTGAERIIQFL